ncbi:tyrosine-type recombinase/integrase [Selenomonas ruminantium]|uniref:Site-specific recombinase XerD n=1 Tax=Selenomonas ruminantium TaxID=971 RepID=A0A1I0Y9Y5_SELRU|nr:tyrosine-type recombinase/integrase [Selenomonas ruminantium]SFB10205.1 Site-specific recombinase XerD [Selenomonas ruminantium]
MTIYNDFLEEIRKTRRQSTYKNYKRALTLFPDGSEDEIVDYIDKSEHSGVTKKNNLRVLSIALKYNGALTKGIHRIISTFKPDEPIQECPTDEQVELVWQNLNKDRDRAIFALMAYMGLRVGEVHNLDLGDITEDGRIIIRKSKGHRADIMPMVHERVERSLQNYIAGERRESHDNALFTSCHGRLSLIYLQQIIKTEFTDNGLGKFHCHSLRRYFANSMYNHGVSLLDMQDCMRHASPETTRRYLNLSQQNRIDAMKKAFDGNVGRRFA